MLYSRRAGEEFMSPALIAVFVVGGFPLIAATVLLYIYERELKHARRASRD
jgi:hypothetical protein